MGIVLTLWGGDSSYQTKTVHLRNAKSATGGLTGDRVKQ